MSQHRSPPPHPLDILDVVAIRAYLTERQAALVARLGKVEHDLRYDTRPLEADSGERAVQLENDDTLVALDDAPRRELVLIRAALERLDRGVFGTCVACGKPIAPRRVVVMPTTLHCQRCAADR